MTRTFAQWADEYRRLGVTSDRIPKFMRSHAVQQHNKRVDQMRRDTCIHIKHYYYAG